jgi:hypothetical protein
MGVTVPADQTTPHRPDGHLGEAPRGVRAFIPGHPARRRGTTSGCGRHRTTAATALADQMTPYRPGGHR